MTFSAGMYQPDSAAGRVIVAHELAHVVQQTRNPGRPTLAPTHLEAEADAAAVDGGAVAGRAPQGSVQRVPTLLDKIAGEELRRRRRKKAAGRAGKAPPVKPPKAVEAGEDVSPPPERDAAGPPGDAPSQTTAPGAGAEAPAKGPDVCELCQSGLLAEADAVLQKAAAGGDMDEKAIEALQQRLLTAERQGQLAGGPGEGPGPAFAKAVELGELRQRRLFAQADALRQKSAAGGAVE